MFWLSCNIKVFLITRDTAELFLVVSFPFSLFNVMWFSCFISGVRRSIKSNFRKLNEKLKNSTERANSSRTGWIFWTNWNIKISQVHARIIFQTAKNISKRVRLFFYCFVFCICIRHANNISFYFPTNDR